MKKLFLLLFTLFLFLSTRALALTYPVTNCADSGAGSLRQAITDANANPGPDTINFNIPTTEASAEADYQWWSVKPATALPAITETVVIDGTTQPTSAAFNNQYGPEIEIDGSGASNAHGIEMQADNCVIKGLAINRFSSTGKYGVFISASDSNKVFGCYIGTNVTGEVDLGNYLGVWIGAGSTYNIIGSRESSGRNIISGNLFGVSLSQTGTNSNEVLGNYIGTNVSGNVALGNTLSGVTISEGAYNRVGGSAAGEGNVVSGNGRDGVHILGNSARRNEVLGNYIGTTSTGASALANSDHGIEIAGGAQYNKVGGITAADRNVISANYDDGVRIAGTGTNSNEVLGNYIGTDLSGTLDLGNNGTGVCVTDEASYNRIGGTITEEGNVISGNDGYGVMIRDNADNNLLAANYIGLDASGAARANGSGGVYIDNGAQYNRIGDGGGAASRNYISGNGFYGIWIAGTGTDSNEVLGNYIGTNLAGTAAVKNSMGGIVVGGGKYNKIGNGTAGGRNVISGHDSGLGVDIYGTGTDSNEVWGNFIGTGSSGATAIPNLSGVRIYQGKYNKIGKTTGQINVISGNANWGILIQSAGTDSNQVVGNHIGTDYNGTSKLANASDGVYIVLGSQFNIIGSLESGGRNVISGNDGSEVRIEGANTNSNEVIGNYIGVGADGASDMNPQGDGVLVAKGASYNKIGGSTTAEGNVISWQNGFSPIKAGVVISGEGTDFNEIKANLIGTASDGATDCGNHYGIRIWDGAESNVIGGTTAGERNIISGNNGEGIYIHDPGSSHNRIIGNYIGTASDGTTDLGNTSYGIWVDNSAHFNLIGTSESGGGNVISGNDRHGIRIVNCNSCEVYGNYVGLDKDGANGLWNQWTGVYLDGSHYNRIGGLLSGEGNVISSQESSSSNAGITISNSSYNRVKGNKIGTDKTGTLRRGNFWGVYVNSGGGNVSQYNIIGGTTEAERNLISGNLEVGIFITGANTASNEVLGNYIGTDVSGEADLGNEGYVSTYAGSGIILSYWAKYNKIGDGTAGGRNLISGNDLMGIGMGINSTTNEVRGNYIGTTSTGAAALNPGSPPLYGIVLSDDSQFNRIDGNLISGNQTGIGLSQQGAGLPYPSYNYVTGNYIGTDSTGTSAIANTVGVLLSGEAQYNYIGDGTAPGRNIISGNTNNGIEIKGTGTNSNEVLGNYIGTDVNGTSGLSNESDGVLITNVAAFNRVGGTGAGEGNVISGNGDDGVEIDGSGMGTDHNVVMGNYIGVDKNGTAALANGGAGVELRNAAAYSIIGSTESGGRNIISSNKYGVSIDGQYTNLNEVLGNYIGTDVNGTQDLGNVYEGVRITDQAIGNYVGNGGAGGGNLISGNDTVGILVNGTGTDSNNILGNIIGLNAGATATLGNSEEGIRVENGPEYARIGGWGTYEHNLICGNSKGIRIDTTVATRIRGNYIGTNLSYATGLGNTGNGISIRDGSTRTEIGGFGAGEPNVIGNNGATGIEINSSQTNEVVGNYIGTDPSGTVDIGNTGFGVVIEYSTSETIYANTIAYNGKVDLGGGFWPSGILVHEPSSLYNRLSQNSIFSNGGLGILLYNGGNNNMPAPVISGFANLGSAIEVRGTATANASIEVFSTNGPDAGGSGEGKSYLGVATADGSGDWTVALASLTPGTTVSATATDTNGNTSMFSLNKVADVSGPYLDIYSPHEGEIWTGGTSRTIECQVYDDSAVDKFSIYYSVNNGASYPYAITTEASLTKVGDRYLYSWRVPYLNHQDMKIRVTVRDVASNYATAESEGFIVSTVPPSISIVHPALDESIAGGATYEVTYVVTKEVELGPLSIRHSTDEGVSWVLDTSSAVADGTYAWSVPAVNSTNCYLSMEAEDQAGRQAQALSGKFEIDTTIPQVTSVTPTNGATDVPAGTTVAAVFSEAMDRTSAQAAFSISPEVSGSFSWSGDERTMTFIPGTVLRGSRLYSVGIGTGAKDRAGHNLASAFASSFTTATPVEHEPPVAVIRIKGVAVKSNDPIPARPTIEARATDNYQMDPNGVKMYLDGTEVACTVKSTSLTTVEVEYRVTSDLAAYTADDPVKHRIKVEATDALGNVGTNEAEGLTVAAAAEAPRAVDVIAYPGTFRPSLGETSFIAYVLNKDADITIYIYGPGGEVHWTRKYASGVMGAQTGYNAVAFDGRSDVTGTILGNGIYPFKIISGSRLIGSGYIVVFD